MNKTILGIIIALVAIAGAIGVYCLYGEETEEDVKNDHIKFAEEYTAVGKDNVFVYKSLAQINKILTSGTGIVYLGFPECPWCQSYIPIVNELAKENGISRIYYYNILEDRKNNTHDYQTTVSILKEYLLTDEEGNPKVFVPEVVFVLNGEIIGHNNDTSVVTEEDGKPEEYWTTKKVNELKEKLTPYFEKFNEKACTTCN